MWHMLHRLNVEKYEAILFGKKNYSRLYKYAKWINLKKKYKQKKQNEL